MALKKKYLIDMDGVRLRGSQMIPGADQSIARLNEIGPSRRYKRRLASQPWLSRKKPVETG